MSANQRLFGMNVGYIPATNAPSATTKGLSTATTWVGLGFLPEATKTVSSFRVFFTAPTGGTLASTDITCNIYSDVSGKPNTLLASSPSASGQTAAGWIDFTGFSQSVTAGLQYWMVLKCPNTTGATYGTAQYWAGVVPRSRSGSDASGLYGYMASITTDGTTWSSSTSSQYGGYRIGYSDGSYQGAPIQTAGATASAIYGSNEVGVQFTTPSNVKLNVRGITLGMFYPVGTPTGTLRFKLYAGGGSLLATTANIPNANVITTSAVGAYDAYFVDGSGNPVSVTLNPNTTYQVTASNSNADSSSNAFRTAEITWDSDANSLSLLPLGVRKVTTSDIGSTFATAGSNVFTPFSLLLDSVGEFTATAAGGSGGVSRGRMLISG